MINCSIYVSWESSSSFCCKVFGWMRNKYYWWFALLHLCHAMYSLVHSIGMYESFVWTELNRVKVTRSHSFIRCKFNDVALVSDKHGVQNHNLWNFAEGEVNLYICSFSHSFIHSFIYGYIQSQTMGKTNSYYIVYHSECHSYSFLPTDKASGTCATWQLPCHHRKI